jgi:ABC-type xylose transport system permease subunit
VNNPLQSIPAKVRTILYVVYGLLALAVLGATGYWAATGDPAPSWVKGIGGVVVALAPVFSATAASNVPPAKPPVETVTTGEAAAIRRGRLRR